MSDWIKERAEQVRAERSAKVTAKKVEDAYLDRALEAIPIVWPQLVEEAKRQAARFNEEFSDGPTKIERVEVGPRRQIILERLSRPAVTVEVDAHETEPYLSIRIVHRGQEIQPIETKDLLYYDVDARDRARFGSIDSLPLTVGEATQRLIEPFFENLV